MARPGLPCRMNVETARIEALLTRALAAPLKIERTTRLSPWFVARCYLASASRAVPVSVIVKGLRDDSRGWRCDPVQVRTERAALEFLERLGSGLAPRLLASDLDARLLVLEDLSPRIPLREVLEGTDAPATSQGLRAFSKTLGRLHATSSGRDAEYYALRSALGPVDEMRARMPFTSAHWKEVSDLATSLGVPPPARTGIEFSDVLSQLAEPGAFLAFSNGDAATNNYLVNRGDGRVIDFEFAGYRHALADIVCLYVPGPHWITVSDPVADGLEAAYRQVLAEAVPETEDDRRFGFGLSACCLSFALGSRFHRLERLRTRADGDDSRVQLVSVLESAANVAEHHRALPHLRGWARAIAAALRRSWPETDVDLGRYPNYTVRTRPPMD